MCSGENKDSCYGERFNPANPLCVGVCIFRDRCAYKTYETKKKQKDNTETKEKHINVFLNVLSKELLLEEDTHTDKLSTYKYVYGDVRAAIIRVSRVTNKIQLSVVGDDNTETIDGFLSPETATEKAEFIISNVKKWIDENY